MAWVEQAIEESSLLAVLQYIDRITLHITILSI